ncbi:complement C1q tumor necrosis factor-related protein 3-like [Clupea harengus]|uniref:Complement C1q tumor necrosis factor-related protein 3-like n=1 Tax=Clupea harengus TaxID=7950 RepID=A0A6P8GSI8_CLUHA|nr:complement C1q tumor necrosis factor-related protein 3-like [Clupea harengus]
MAHTTLFFLALLGCLCLGLASGMRGDSDLTVELRELRVLVKDMEAKLNDFGTKDGNLKALETRLNAMEQQVEKLQSEVQRLGKENQESTKVAFSTSLSSSGEVFLDHSSPNVVYKHIFINAGNAYDSKTGAFTAPVKGLYYFSFSTFGYNNFPGGTILNKNGRLMVSTYEFSTSSDQSDTGGNSVILQLEAGEKVTMTLHKSHVFDNDNHHTTFSGFLLFPL